MVHRPPLPGSRETAKGGVRHPLRLSHPDWLGAGVMELAATMVELRRQRQASAAAATEPPRAPEDAGVESNGLHASAIPLTL